MESSYFTVCETQINNFNSEVNVYLERGWELYGSPYTILGSLGEEAYSAYCQALTKERRTK